MIKNYPEYWEKLKALPKENLAFARFNRTETIEQLDKRLNAIIEADKAQIKIEF